ncbi:MAG: pilus assembly protein [Lachnospiraceae bacterium]|nr:pilus assembly protein [Lachnospiraceae bacterium]
MGKGKIGNKGMMTIEACVIIPLSLMITFLLLWTGMLLYNRTAVNYAVSTAVIQGSRMAEQSNEEISDYVQKKIFELLENKLVLMEMPQMEVKVEYGMIRAGMQGYLNAPVLAGFCGNWSVEAQYSAERMRSSQIVRTIRRVDRLAEKHREQDRNGEGTVTEMQTEGGTEE